jgi:hypothetical protein
VICQCENVLASLGLRCLRRVTLRDWPHAYVALLASRAVASPDLREAEVCMIDWNNLVSTGNAVKDGHRGWFVGQFIPASCGLAHQRAVEIKWGQHLNGEQRKAFAQSAKATTIAILIYGSLVTRLKLPDGIHEITLTSPGDYVAFGPGIDHTWESVEDCLVITVRFPSSNGQQ